MAQFRQSGADRFAVRGHIDPQSSSSAADQISIRVPNKHHHHHHRIRRPVKPHRRISAAVVGAVTLTLALLVTILSIHHLSGHRQDVDDVENGSYQNQSLPHKELKFGHGSNLIGRDSRYWDSDDRSRDHDYGEEEANATRYQDEHRGNNPIGDELKKARDKNVEGGGLYNEGGRAELDAYKEKYETEEANAIDEYDDGVDVDDDQEEEDHNEEDVTHGGDPLISGHDDGRRNLGAADLGVTEKDKSFEATDKVSYGRSKSSGSGPPTKKDNAHTGGELMKLPTSGKKSALKRKSKHHKFSSVSCEMKFLDSAAQLVEPVENKKFSRFSLQYTDTEKWEPRFAGHQTLQEREASFYAHNQRINCGFIQGPSRSASTGFDLAEDDLKFMSSCHIAVSSCIFGNSDHLRSPFGKTITRQSRKNVCFVMFVDQVTLETLSSEGQGMDSMGFIGLWKIVVVKNMPYSDMRRVGKIPKFLAHRLFPSARYSIWLDSKLRLQKDPYLILEYFLWRRGYEYAISNHYDRHCVWEEVLQNKKLNKFNHTIIDQQFEFYQSDGLKRFDPSDPNKLLPSYVPEGSFIVRAHTPMSNLFSCLWFNEVDRFTPRDQLSFAYTYLKLRSMNLQKTFHLNMFKDCERRSIAKLFRHRAEEKPAVPTHAAD